MYVVLKFITLKSCSTFPTEADQLVSGCQGRRSGSSPREYRSAREVASMRPSKPTKRHPVVSSPVKHKAVTSSPVKQKAPVFHIKQSSVSSRSGTPRTGGKSARKEGGDTSPVSDLLCMSDIPDAQKYSDSAGVWRDGQC